MKSLIALTCLIFSLSSFAQYKNTEVELPIIGESVPQKNLTEMFEALRTALLKEGMNKCNVPAFKDGSRAAFNVDVNAFFNSVYHWHFGYNGDNSIVAVYDRTTDPQKWFFRYVTDSSDTKIIDVKFSVYKVIDGARVNEGTIRHPRFVTKKVISVLAEGSCFKNY